MAYGNMPQQTAQTNFGYDRETDYQKLIEDAVKAGDYTRAAIYEAQRNEKIAGEGAPYQPTYQYASYLPGGTGAAQTSGQGGQGAATGAALPTAFGYDPNTDYQALIQQAASAGDYARAAIYEAQRNEKIAGTGAAYEPTYNYANYLPGNQQAGQPNGQPAPTGAAQQGVEQVNLQASVMPQYVNPYQEELDAAIAGLDPEAYKRFYLQEANRSAQDVLGKYAAMTGGIPSTAAVSAASQAADYQKSQLGAKIVDLNAQRANLLMNAGQMAENNYQARISAAMNRWTQLGYADQQVQDILGVPVGTPTSDQSYANWSKSQAEQQVQREQEQAAKTEAYNMAMTLLSAGMMPDAATLAIAGIPQSYAQALYSMAAKQTSGQKTPYTPPNGSGMKQEEFDDLTMKAAALAGLGGEEQIRAAIAYVQPYLSQLSEAQQATLIKMIEGLSAAQLEWENKNGGN